MHPILKDWLQNLGCLLPLGFLSFFMVLISHWVATETGPARTMIIWQARFLGQDFPKLTMAVFLLPTLLSAWLLFIGCRRVLTRMGVYKRPTKNAGFNKSNGNT